MIVSWTSSKTLVSRIYRNMKGVQAEYGDSIMEWIPEAVLKLKTVYSLEVRGYEIQIQHHQGMLPVKIEGLVCVLLHGRRVNYYDNGRIAHHPDSAGTSLFQSVVPIYTSSGDISAGDTGRSKFPTDVLAAMDMEAHHDHWYKVNGRYLETSLKEGCLKAWVQCVPKDTEGYPLIPDNEFVQEAIYRYCRMMLIEAGYEDKVMNHAQAKQDWKEAAGQAIGDTCYPTPDQVESSVHRHLDNFFPDNTYF